MIREHGQATAEAWIALVLEEADMLCGGRNTPGTIAMFGRMALQHFGHRSVEAMILAIRDGMNAKVYGQLTWPQIAEWFNAHEEAVMDVAYNESAVHKFVDNGGRDSLDRQQHNADADKRKMARMSAHIEDLKAKLSNHESGQGNG